MGILTHGVFTQCQVGSCMEFLPANKKGVLGERLVHDKILPGPADSASAGDFALTS